MKRLALAGVLTLSTLWFPVAVTASTPPALPKPVESFNAGSIRVDVYGTANAPALVFIPGLTCGPWEWSNEIRRFSPSHRIYALTLPGFDGAPSVEAPLFDAVSADFWTLLQQRHIEKPTLIGHSIGGTLAILLAEQHPSRLREVIAVDGLPVFPGTESMTQTQRAETANRTSAMLRQMQPEQFAASQRRSLPYMVTAPADAEAIGQRAGKADPAGTAQWTYEDLMLDLRPALKTVTIPLVEIAPFDPGFDPLGPAHLDEAAAKKRYYASLFAGAPNAEVRIIAPSRHFLMYDQPGPFDEALTAVLR